MVLYLNALTEFSSAINRLIAMVKLKLFEETTKGLTLDVEQGC